MGLFSKLFKKDPQAELAKLEAMISRGENPEKALKLASKLEGDADAMVRTRAAALSVKLKESQAAELLANAKRSEQGGNIGDALDWMQAALPYLEGEQRESLIRRIEELDESMSDGPARPLISAREADPEEPEGDGHEVDFDIHFEMLIGMLEPKIAELYTTLPRAFHEGFVNFNNGDVDHAIEVYEGLMAELPNNSVLQFERGRCCLFKGEFEQARDLLEKAWSAFGDDFLDEAQSLSVPLLWADAMLALEKPNDVVLKLEPLADPRDGRPLVSQVYALALEAAGRLEEAKKFLVKAGSRFDRMPNFPFLLARVMEQMGDWQGAINVLESKVGPKCAGGSCGPNQKHPASMRMLIALYLEHKQNLSAAGDLLMHLESALKGNLSRSDLLMAAEYHRQTGDDEAAVAAEEAAARLDELEGTGLEQDVTSTLSAGNKAVL